MYKASKEYQGSFYDFNSDLGFAIDPKNRWVQRAKKIPWSKIEEKYASLFKSKKGKVAKPLRVALGALLVQKHFNCSDKELINLIKESPYLQYFIGLNGYEYKSPFSPSFMVKIRRRFTDDLLAQITKKQKL